MKRKYCIADNKSEINHLHTFKNFPLKVGCTDSNISGDKYFDMVWGASENGIVQLMELIDLDLLYSDTHNPGAIGKIWEKHHQDFSNFIGRNINEKKILEIGGASGILVNFFLDTDLNFRWDIVEPSKQKFDDDRVNFFNCLFENFSSKEKYDYVVNSHLLEHVYNPLEFLTSINDYLNLGGVQFISIPNIEHWLKKGYSNSLNFEHTYFYNQKVIEHLLRSTGFHIDKIIEGTHSIFIKCIKVQSVKNVDVEKQFLEIDSENIFLNYIDSLNNSVEEINNLNAKEYSIFLFGGHIFSQILLNIGVNEDSIIGILDNDPNKIGKRLYGYNQKVFSPFEIKFHKNPCVVIKAGVYSSEISKQLIEINPKTKIIF